MKNVYLTRPGSELALRTVVFDPTWLDPVAESRVAPATGSTQVGSNTISILRRYKSVIHSPFMIGANGSVRGKKEFEPSSLAAESESLLGPN